jgi:hypothetical protein
MTRFVLSAAIAAVAAVATSSTANAQIVYNYTRPAPGGVVSGNVAIGPTAATSFSTYYSPFTGTMASRALYRNSFGQAYGSNYLYNPALGVVSRNVGFYQPGFYFNPYAGGSFGLTVAPGFGAWSQSYRFYGYPRW